MNRYVYGLITLLTCFHIVSARANSAIVANGNFEADQDANQWPDKWPVMKAGGSWVEEGGNRFLRLTQTSPGATTMMYHEIAIPAGVEALEMTWRQRITDLIPGKQAWFDARIMMEFMDAGRNKASPSPGAPYSRKSTDGWVEKSASFLVPTNAAILKFMPSLFQVEAGTFDLDDVVLRPIAAAPLIEAQKAAKAAQAEKHANQEMRRRDKAAAVLAEHGSLIPNGDFETSSKNNGIPDGWGALKDGSAWVVEDGNRFMRIHADAPGKMLMVYRTYDIPAGIEAMELKWRHRISGLKVGEKPWFDARIMMEFLDAKGEKLSAKPSPSYAQRDSEGWVDRSTMFLIPSNAVSLVLMPCLFNVKSGTYELDDFSLKPADPAPLYAAAAKRELEIKARYVPPEEPNPSRWPKEIRVVGNRLHDPDGNEVWLQGVNAGGLETLPQDDQPVKSLVVAIDEWKANCVRVPIKENFWYGDSPYQQDGGKYYRDKIDFMVTLAANRGAYIVLDLHRYRAPKQEHADFWKDCAARYKDHPAVLFDILNEPHGISWEVWRNGGFVENEGAVDESAFLTPEEKEANRGFHSIGMQALVDAVRSTGARNIVIAGGLYWCNDLTGVVNGYALDDPTGNGIMYSWHTYNWHTDWATRVLPAAEKFPIFLGEVGADIKKMGFIPLEDQEDPYTWVPDMLGFIQKHRINWTGWCFHPRATPVMITDWSYTPSPFWGQFAKDALSGKQFEMKRMR
jgi:hypothetical protein